MATNPEDDSVALELTFRGKSLTGPNREANIEALQAAVKKALTSGATLSESFKPQGLDDLLPEIHALNRKR
jgi:hypothetical protein